MTEPDVKKLVDEMESVKKLLMLQLLAMGYKQKHIASVLGISEAKLSRMLPKAISKDAAKVSASNDSENVVV